MPENRTEPGIDTPQKRQLFRQSPFKSRLFTIAFAITLLGAGLWVYAAVTKPEPPMPAPSLAHPSTGFAAAPDAAGARAAEAEPRTVDKAAPATFRLGLSFLGGYFLGWAVRTFIKATLLIGGAISLLIFALQKFNVIDIDWDALGRHLSDSFAWARGEAEHLRTLAMGLLPSAGAGAAGAFVGFRKA